MTEHAVVIAGGGPTGMALAAELTLAGVDVVVVERRTSHELESSRAGGLHARTIEVFDQRGVAERFLAAGEVMQIVGYSQIQLDLSDFPSRHPYGLALWQSHIERIMGEWIAELGVAILRGREVVGLGAGRRWRRRRARRRHGAAGALPRRLRRRAQPRAQGGGDRLPRHRSDDELDPRRGRDGRGARVRLPARPHRPARHRSTPARRADRLVLNERKVDHASDPTMDELRARSSPCTGRTSGCAGRCGSPASPTSTRQAAEYRPGRVLLAGDAAHVHPPMGGQGLNIGVQDAVNLGWKLAQVVDGTSPDALLDTYHAERHPVAARVLRHTQGAGRAEQPRRPAPGLRRRPRRAAGDGRAAPPSPGCCRVSTSHYDLGDGHPLVGRRMPDLDLRTADGADARASRAAARRPAGAARPRRGGAADVAPWADRCDAWTPPTTGRGSYRCSVRSPRRQPC